MANDILVKIMKESKDISHHDFHIHHDFNNSLSNTSFSTALNDAVKPVLKKKKKKLTRKPIYQSVFFLLQVEYIKD